MFKKFRKGSGEFIAFAFIGSIMCMVIAYVGALLVYSCASSDMTKMLNLTSRAVALSESHNDAERIANKLIKGIPLRTNINGIELKVQNVTEDASADQWRMGDYVQVELSADIATPNPFNNIYHYNKKALVTLENGDEPELDVFSIKGLNFMPLDGMWRLTGYCNCSACCGQWAGGPTASGVMPQADRTIAIHSSVMNAYGLHFGDKLLIRGKVYTLEDHGGSEMAGSNGGRCIDIYVDQHQECYSDYCNGYAQVFRITGSVNPNNNYHETGSGRETSNALTRKDSQSLMDSVTGNNQQSILSTSNVLTRS